MPLRSLSPLSPRSLNFRLIAGFFIILLLIFSVGNVIVIRQAREQLDRHRDEQIAAQRETLRADIAQAEQRLHGDLEAQLAIVAVAVRGPLQNQVSLIHDDSDPSKERVIEQFAACIDDTTTARIYQCLKARAHYFSLDSIGLINHSMIKTLIDLLLSHEALVAVEVLDWEDRLFDGYALDQEGSLHPLRERFANPARTLVSMEQPVIEDDYLGRVIFHYRTDAIDALARRAEESIAQFIASSNENVRAATRQMTRTRLIEEAILFLSSLLAISLITLMTIIQPLRQITRHAENIANGYWHFIQACDTSAQRRDELGILIRTFNLMSETIRRSHQELQDANTRLERKVAERTRELEEKNKQLETLASTDRLTEISNRSKLDESFGEQMQRAQRYGRPFSILLCDVDFFKRVNDTHGHQCGDQVLVTMAKLLKSSMRKTDLVGRWGGEEFLVILPETQLQDAVTLAERFRGRVAAHAFPCVQTAVTISAGLSSYQVGTTQDAMIELADQALYRAKSEGRNRVRF